MTKSRPLLTAYATCAGGFLLLDACWLSLMGERLYRPVLGPMMRTDIDWLAAALFYVIYLAGIVGFAVAPALAAGHGRAALLRGAAFGFLCYATYDLTNQATLVGWAWHVTLADLAWGSTATALAAWLGWRVARASASNADQ